MKRPQGKKIMYTTDKTSKSVFRAAFAFIFIYAAAFLFFHALSPSGMTPVLDGAENILLADQIFSGTLPDEPFYRAMLYPALLSMFRSFGIATEDLSFVAAILGIFLHLANTLLISLLSYKIWASSAAGLAGMLLFGLYPPALHFAAEPLDITIALSAILLTITLCLSSSEDNKISLYAAAAGLTLGIGTIIRPNILPIAGIWVFQLFRPSQRKHALLALLCLALPLITGGYINYQRSGQFRIMPWQGSFSLYVANNAKANGKYFSHSVYIPDRKLGENPARLESEILYSKATGKIPSDIDQFNRFWRQKTIGHITSAPTAWLKLMLKKTYYLFNDFEQYNNKTLSFHKALSPVLRYNPLGFGILLVLAIVALLNSPMNKEKSLIIQIFGFLGSGVLMFFVSARFRLLLVPSLTIMAAGFFHLLCCERQRILNKKNLIIAAITALVTFSGFADARDTSTYKTDRLLLAYASARLNLFPTQIKWAQEVLNDDPEDIQAIRIKLLGFSNIALSGQKTSPQAWKQISNEISYLQKNNLSFSDTLFIQGCYMYSVAKQPENAFALWNEGLKDKQQQDIFLAALILTKVISPEKSMITLAKNLSLLHYALVKYGLMQEDPEGLIHNYRPAVKFLFDLEI